MAGPRLTIQWRKKGKEESLTCLGFNVVWHCELIQEAYSRHQTIRLGETHLFVRILKNLQFSKIPCTPLKSYKSNNQLARHQTATPRTIGIIRLLRLVSNLQKPYSIRARDVN